MKVRRLIEELEKLDPEMAVLCYTEDPDLLAENQGFKLFEIEGVQGSEGERSKTDDGIPTLKLGRGPHSEKLAILNVTADF